MNQVGVTKEQLQERKTIDNPIEPLYWEYYCYVVENPVLKWQSPTSILRGEFDTLCENKVVLDFAKQFGCRLEEIFNTNKNVVMIEMNYNGFFGKGNIVNYKRLKENALFNTYPYKIDYRKEDFIKILEMGEVNVQNVIIN